MLPFLNIASILLLRLLLHLVLQLMAPKAKAKVKATKTLAKNITARVKKGKWIGKMKKEAVPKLKLKNENGADDGAEADDEDDRAPAAVEEENEDGVSNGFEDNEDGFSNGNRKSKAHEEFMKRICEKIREFRNKCKTSGPIDKQKVVKMMKEHFSKTQQSSLWQIGDKLIMDSSSPVS